MIFIIILTLIVAKALPSLNTKISSIQIVRISSISLIFALILTLNTYNITSIGSGIGIYSGLFHITNISHMVEIFIYLISSLILISWPQIQKLEFVPLPSYLDSDINQNLNGKGPVQGLNEYKLVEDKHSTDYSIIILFSVLGSSLLISSFDLISLYLSIELQSFGLYILSTLYRNSETATSAGLKYFLLGGLSSCLILLGSGVIYSYSGITNFESLYILSSVSDVNQQYVITGISLGLIIIFVGFLFKIAAAPLHNWSPDVYDGVPTIVTTWLTIIPKISILILLLELYTNMGIIGGLKTILISNSGYISTLNMLSLPLPGHWDLKIESIADLKFFINSLNIENIKNSILVANATVLKNLFLISSILSLIIGSLLGLAQVKIKRLLAYSTISHIGFILLALAINTEQSIESFIFYIVQYTITNLNIFLIILALTYIVNNKNNINNYITNFVASLPGQGSQENKFFNDLNYISEFKGLFFSNPLLSISLGVCLFSMAGIPPLIGFFSKQFVLYSAIQNGYYFISIVAIILSVISASYYLKIVKVLFTTPSEPSQDTAHIASATATGTNINIHLTNIHSFLISSLTLFIILFFIKPSLILNSTQLLSLSLFYI